MTTQDHIHRIERVERIVDGDTYFIHVDTGFYASLLCHARLYGYDTPELNSANPAERAAANDAKSAAIVFFSHLDSVTYWLRSIRRDPDSFGRWLVDIWREDSSGTATHLGPLLADQGLAVVSPDGRAKWRDTYLSGGTNG